MLLRDNSATRSTYRRLFAEPLGTLLSLQKSLCERCIRKKPILRAQ
jgi:hypothetical protein